VHLNAFTDYGFRVLMVLAGAPDTMFSAHKLAADLKVSPNHLNKVITTMAKAGFVLTQRGHGGGIRLARPAEGITLGDVVRVMEKKTALVECFRPDGGKCTIGSDCRLRDRLSAAQSKFLEDLDRSTIADCAYPSSGPRP